MQLAPQLAAPLLEGGPAEAEPELVAARPARLPLLDNARAVLICLVVLYHMAVVYTSSDRPEAPIPYWSGVLTILKPVVMPGFCLVSGHLSRASLDATRALALFQLFVTFVIFQVLYHCNDWLSFTLADFKFDAIPLAIFAPKRQVVTWFLLALVLWRGTLPLVARLRIPLTCSVAVGLAALFADLGLNHQNLLAFFPYFVAGHLMPRSAWNSATRAEIRWPLAVLFVLVAAAVIIFSGVGGSDFDDAFHHVTRAYGCFNGEVPAAEPRVCYGFEAVLLRAAFYVASAPLMAGFFCVLPQSYGWYTYMGFMSMYIYTLHPLIITNGVVMKYVFDGLSSLYGREVNVWSPATSGSACLMLVPVSLLVCGVLSLPVTRCLFWPFVEPPVRWLFRAPDGTPPHASSAPPP